MRSSITRNSKSGGMKLKVGKLTVEEDIERTRLARKTGGPKFHLTRQRWRLASA